MRENCSSDRGKGFQIQGWRPRICKKLEAAFEICSKSERSEQFLKQNISLVISGGFHIVI